MQERDQLIEEGTTFSLESIVDFIENDTDGLVLVIISIAFAILPFAVLVSFLNSGRRSRKRLERIYNNGRKTVGTILNLKETGVRINEQPLAEISIKFQHNGDELIRSSWMVVSVLTPPRIGDLINVIYDSVRDKLFILNDHEEIETRALK